MSNENKGFDLSALVKTDLLELRGIAQQNLFFTVGDLFALLYRFKTEGHRASEALAEISSGVSEEACIRAIQDVKELLEGMGCKQWPLIFSDVINTVTKNNIELSADFAKSILEPFTELYNQIIDTEITGTPPPDYLTISENTEIETAPLLAQTLIKVLDRIELEEHDRKLQILVIDDSTSTIQAVFSALNSIYKVYGMTDPSKLEKFLEKVTPELFLLDYKMPKRTGFELIPIIRSLRAHKTTPIIILTATSSIDHISASHSLGACDYIVKPFNEDTLRKKIAKHIKKKDE